MAIVVDACVALSWLFADEFTPASADLFEQAATSGVVAPSHWLMELANGALMGERRKRVSAADIDRWGKQIVALDAAVDTSGSQNGLVTLLPLARAHDLTIYDTAYLELATRRGLALATFDTKLQKAARSMGITILGV